MFFPEIDFFSFFDKKIRIFDNENGENGQILARNGKFWAKFEFFQGTHAFTHSTIENNLNVKNEQTLMNGFQEKCKNLCHWAKI